MDIQPIWPSIGAPSRPISSLLNRATWVLVAVIAASYFIGLTPGHVFAQDDFAAYVMHAANMVDGRPYTQIHYVGNPEAPWISPANGYPPAYPLLLAPVYWRWGINLRLMKSVTVGTFAVFLGVFALWVRPLVSPRERVAAVALVGLSPAFWSYRDLISSEFPYLMISFFAVLVMRRANFDRRDEEWRTGWAVLFAFLMYASYATRTIGIALPIAFAIAELQVRRKLSRFALLTLSVVAGCILLQAASLTSPSGYVSVVRVTLGTVASNAWFYTKSLTYAWQNGFSKPAQVVLAFFLTGLAAWAFARRIRRGASVDDWYLLILAGNERSLRSTRKHLETCVLRGGHGLHRFLIRGIAGATVIAGLDGQCARRFRRGVVLFCPSTHRAQQHRRVFQAAVDFALYGASDYQPGSGRICRSLGRIPQGKWGEIPDSNTMEPSCLWKTAGCRTGRPDRSIPQSRFSGVSFGLGCDRSTHARRNTLTHGTEPRAIAVPRAVPANHRIFSRRPLSDTKSHAAFL